MEMLKNNPYISLIARIVLGCVFIVVGVTKIAEPKLFANEIGNYQMLPDLLVNIPAIILPWLELVTGLMLILGIKLKETSFIAGILLIVFTLGVAIAWARGLDINCGCFSTIKEEKVGLSKILQNSGLLVLTYLIFISKSIKFRLDRA
jgi:uncharacterized membrane protein YphA (DoxX/SURF4 family)